MLLYIHVFLCKKRRRGHGIGEVRPGTNGAQSLPRTRCWRSFMKKGNREMEPMCIVYISMFMFSLDINAEEPWYLIISSNLE
jgi:hypothetical protein